MKLCVIVLSTAKLKCLEIPSQQPTQEKRPMQCTNVTLIDRIRSDDPGLILIYHFIVEHLRNVVSDWFVFASLRSLEHAADTQGSCVLCTS